jgi:hypothetical protein
LTYELELTAALSATLLKVLFALDPSEVMAAMHTTTIKASMTAYSTAVGPLSSFRKFTAQDAIRDIIFSLLGHF